MEDLVDGYIGPIYEQLVADIDRAIPERDRLSGNSRVLVNRTLRLFFEHIADHSISELQGEMDEVLAAVRRR